MAATKLEVVNVSTERLLKQIKLANMCMQSVTNAVGTSMWEITKRCRTSMATAEMIAEVLHCEVDDFIIRPKKPDGTPQITASMLFGPECYESGKCFARNDAGRCRILSTTYGRYEKRCPFRKEKRSERPCAD